MKLAFILPDLNLSGGNRIVATYADELTARGHYVSVIVARPMPTAFRHRVTNLMRTGKWIPDHLHDDTHFHNNRATMKLLSTPGPVTDRDVPDCDIVIATWWKTAEWVNNLSSTKGAKVLFIQGYEIREDASADLLNRLKATWRMPFHKIVISEWLGNISRDEYGVEPVAIVPNGINLDLFHVPNRTRQRVPTVGLLYSPAPFKGIDIAVMAINLVRVNIPELKVVAFGVKEPVPDLTLPENTTYHQSPSQASIPDIYGSCDVWLFPSRREGFGLPILEAMACRTPVIATPAGAAPELLSEGGGFLIEPEDPQAMANAIEKLFLINDDDWRELSDKAFATAQQYAWKEAVDNFENALFKVLGKPVTEALDA